MVARNSAILQLLRNTSGHAWRTCSVHILIPSYNTFGIAGSFFSYLWSSYWNLLNCWWEMWLASILVINTLTMLTIAYADRCRPTLKDDERPFRYELFRDLKMNAKMMPIWMPKVCQYLILWVDLVRFTFSQQNIRRRAPYYIYAKI